MRKITKKSRSHHRVLKERTKNRLDDLQGLLSALQSARKDGHAADAAVFEEQVHQVLREWKTELNQSSPAVSSSSQKIVDITASSSLDLSAYICRMLQLNEEEDDAASKLNEPQTTVNLKAEQQNLPVIEEAFLEEYFITQEMPEQGLIDIEQYAAFNCIEGTPNSEYQQFNLHHQLPPNVYFAYNAVPQNCEDQIPVYSELIPATYPPSTTYLRPKCALWDCPRPATGTDWFEDYCSSFHAVLALNEGPSGMTPVLRPGGIDLKDGPLFAALTAKTLGKNVGIPECEGAATTKSPWNAPELFDLLVLNGESLREWLFFDKPRRAFESGNRKQRSLPDYNGRGWHESRKQVMKEFGGLKRSYYMDPQPLSHFEWHLYEYEINNCDVCALYRLELKLVPKKFYKGKITGDPLTDLQQQMGRLGAENFDGNKRFLKGRTKLGQNDAILQNAYLASQFVGQIAGIGIASNKKDSIKKNNSWDRELQ